MSPSSTLLPFLGEGSPTKIDYGKKGTLILSSLLEDLDHVKVAIVFAQEGIHSWGMFALHSGPMVRPAVAGLRAQQAAAIGLWQGSLARHEIHRHDDAGRRRRWLAPIVSTHGRATCVFFCDTEGVSEKPYRGWPAVVILTESAMNHKDVPT